MFLPYNVDVPMYRMPIANWVLIGFTTLVSLYIIIEEYGRQSRHNAPPIRIPQNKKFTPEDIDEIKDLIDQMSRQAEDSLPAMAMKRKGFSILQPFTYVFVHADLLHLIGNMVFLFVFGNAVNAKLGHGLFLACYFVLGAFSGICWLLMSSGPALVGASGAIMGLVGIFFVLFPKNDVQILYVFTLALSGSIRLAAFWVILFYLGGDLWGTLSGGGGGVAYIAHLAGGVAGMAIAVGLLKGRIIKSDYGEENMLQWFKWQEQAKRRKKKLRRLPVAGEED
jgi:membrane associated rhomboid family serine protease